MGKHAMILTLTTALSIGLLLSSCGNTDLSETEKRTDAETTIAERSDENTTEAALSKETEETVTSSVVISETIESAEVVQGGPYGQISLSIPDGWDYETFPIDNGELFMGLYGIRFYPSDAVSGYIELDYADSFGVCGTGLNEEQAVIAGKSVMIGTYDNNPYWDFISFLEDHRGIVALTYGVEDWWETYGDQVTDILNTLSFDSSVKEGGAYVYSAESQISRIGLSFSLKNIAPTGATIVFNQYDANAPTGEVEYGDAFVLEVQKDGAWEEAAITLEGDYGFHDIAYVIPSGDTSEQELNWEWLYGTLAPGNYRIVKNVIDSRGSGDYDKYTVYAQFVLN